MAIASIVIMLLSALVGFLIGDAINSAPMIAILFTMIAGFACTIYTIENNKKE